MEVNKIINLAQCYNWYIYLIIGINTISIVSAVLVSFIISYTTRRRRLKKRSVCNGVFYILLFAQTCISSEIIVMMLTFSTYKSKNKIPSEHIHKIHQSLFNATFSMVLFSYSLVTLDRFIAVNYCFLYRRLNYKFPLSGGILMVVFSVATFFIQFSRKDVKKSAVVEISFSLATLILILFGNFRIYLVVKKTFSTIKSNTVGHDGHTTIQLKRSLSKREVKVTKACLRVALTYVLFIFPGPVLVLLQELFPIYLNNVPDEVEMVFTILASSNHTMDPWFFLFGSTNIMK